MSSSLDKTHLPNYRHYGLIASLIFTGSLVFTYMFWFARFIPIIFMPLTLALLIYLLAHNLGRVTAPVISGTSVLIGFGIAANLFQASTLEWFYLNWATYNPDVFPIVFQEAALRLPFALPILEPAKAVFIAIVMASFSAGFTYLFSEIEERSGQLKRWLPHILITLIAINFLIGITGDSTTLLQQLSEEPVEEQYQYDAFIYLKAFYKVSNGEFYYSAMPQAILGDGRMNQLNDMMLGYTTVRMPTIFYIWRILAFGQGINLFFLSVVLTIAAIVLLFYAIRGTSGAGIAGLSAIFVAPYLYVGASWINICFPDWWAAIFALFSIALFMRKQHIGAAALAALAALTREPMGLLIVAGLAAGILTRERKIWLSFGVALVLFLGMYWGHQQMVKAYFALDKSGLDWYFRWNFKSLFTTTNYLAFPISIAGINMLLPFAAIFSAFFQKDWKDRVFISSFLLGFVIYIYIMHTASYWGQMFIPIILISLPLVLRPFVSTWGVDDSHA